MTLGYTLPWKIQYVDNIRLSFSGENLFVLSGFSGVDPELPAEVGNKYKAGSVGVAISPYPQARKFMFGLNVTVLIKGIIMQKNRYSGSCGSGHVHNKL